MVYGNWLLAQRLVTTILFKLLRLVFITVQSIYWHLNGTAKQLREARLARNYERSAQVLNVVFCHKFCYMHMITVADFVCTHNRFENPQYIIDNDNITLMTINERDAIFCEAREKGTQRLFVSDVARNFFGRSKIQSLGTEVRSGGRGETVMGFPDEAPSN